MRRKLVASTMLLLALAGCGPKSPEAVVTKLSGSTAATLTPAERTYEQVYSGLYQIEASLDHIEEARNEAKSTTAASGDVKQSLEDIQASIDSAGDGLAEDVAVPLDKSQVIANIEVGEKRRKQLCIDVNDALHDLRDARGIVDSLAGDKDTGPVENVGLEI